MNDCSIVQSPVSTRRAARAPWTPGHSLPQGDYIDADLFQRDLALLGEHTWMVVDHVSRIPKAGDFFVHEFGADSIVVIRDRSLQVRAFYNVCRHRGSRICLTDSGTTRTLSCPYHAWTYDLEGKLISVPLDDGRMDKSTLGLQPAHVRVFQGLIFLNHSKGTPPSFDDYVARFEPFLAPYGLQNARVAARRTFPTSANWKLLVENFFECYHCKPSHPTYCRVHDELKMLAMGAGPGSGGEYMARYAPIYDAWCARQRGLGRWVEPFSDGAEAPHFQSAGQIPIREGAVTESLDGQPVAPAMTAWGGHDGVQSGCVFNPVSTVLANPDFTIVFRMTPRTVLSSECEAIWLVRADAVEGKDYDVDRMCSVWLPTLGEDKTITENNQRGVLSSRYAPGPYQPQEQRIAEFAQWYRRLSEDA
jgi:Rieske 2Fe-2S family protein